MLLKQLEVVAAIIIKENSVLCVQRKINKYNYLSFKYEFPGGKVEIGESNEEALKREINEELNMDLTILEKFLTIYHEYPDFGITMHSYICTSKTENPTLTEHADFKFLSKDKLDKLDWAAADIPIVNKLMNS